MVISMKKIWKDNSKLIIAIVVTIVLASGATYAATTMYDSNTVSYDNTISGLNSTNVQSALDEIYSAATDYTAILARLSALEAVIGDVQEIYPVGSIYIGVNNTNPSTLFGGTWTAFGTGKTLVGVDTSQTEFDTVEETGGAKTKSYTPAGTVGNTTLTVAQIPSHTHTASNNLNKPFSTFNSDNVDSGSGVGFTSINRFYFAQPVSISISSTGGGKSHTHSFTGTATSIDVVQPYITVYMWKRTA